MLLLFFAGETPGGRRLKKWTDKCKACSQRCLRGRKKGRTLSQQYHAARGPLAEAVQRPKAKGFGARLSDAIGASTASVRASCSRVSGAVRASRASIRLSLSRASGALVRDADAETDADPRTSRMPSLTPVVLGGPGRRGTAVGGGPGLEGRRATLHRNAAMRRSIIDASMLRPPSPAPGLGSARSTGSAGSAGSARSTGSLGGEDEATLSPDEEEESPVAGVGTPRGAKGKAAGVGGLHRIAQAEGEEGDGDGGDSAASVAVYAAMQRGVEWRREQTKKHETTSPAIGALPGRSKAPKRARRQSVAVAARGAARGAVKGTKTVARHAAVAASGLLSPLPSPPSSPTSEPISEATPQLISPKLISDDLRRRSPTISDDLDEEARERLLGAIAFGRSANAARSERPPGIRQA